MPVESITPVKDDAAMGLPALPVSPVRLSAENPDAVLTPAEVIRCGQEIVATAARALETLVGQFAGPLQDPFAAAAQRLARLEGNLIVTGMGKAGLIGQKLAATFSSTGTRAHFLHPAEAFHGDLGRVHRGDVVLALSQSGETSELNQLLGPLSDLGVPIIAITASGHSTLGQQAAIALPLGDLREACPLGLAPSTSTSVMLALGDALALVVSRLRGFRAEDFARFHPGGSLGRKLSAVDDHMRPLTQCRIARDSQTIREVLVSSTRPGRRSGAIMLVDEVGRLTGLFTDSDLARLFEARNETSLDRPIRHVMVTTPTTVASGSGLSAAVEVLVERKFSELPVVDESGRPVGMIDVTDLIEIETEAIEPFPLSAGPAGKAPGSVDPAAIAIRLFPGDAC
jgi:arabinose-5-phosphate isomerase